ncbi:hypothetical protein J4Q44_G00302770 [Coregonus suidteri]|uniref:Uncharacterized protein n=1 Tax=Coregonus suidteri TaxID=861788 RepID=A0AAN8KWF8_9TELE
MYLETRGVQLIIGGSLVAVVLVLAVVVGVYCIRKRRTPPQSPAPVSSLQLSSQCLTHGAMRVSCSSEGDGPQYSWTLDEHPLRDTEASSGDETNTITLKKGLSGDLTVPSKTKSTVSL